jgi:ribonuclease HI
MTKYDKVSIAADGAARNNGKGISSWAFIVIVGEEIVGRGCEIEHQLSNNQVEYLALIAGLKWCVKNGVGAVDVYQDSQLVSRQMSGEYAVRSPTMMKLYDTAVFLEDLIGDAAVSYHWVPREHPWIKIVDKMCNDKMDGV